GMLRLAVHRALRRVATPGRSDGRGFRPTPCGLEYENDYQMQVRPGGLTMRRTALLGLGVLLTVVAVLVSCSSPSPMSGNGALASTGTARTVDVVASTDVWGSVLSAIGGQYVDVNAIISDPSV